MIDPDLERRLSDCKELLTLWHQFHGYFSLAAKGDNSLLTHDKEAEFLDLKSRIAMLHDSFMESLKHDAEIGQHILNIIERTITLKHLCKLSTAEFKKMEIEWHESYLLLSETVASIEEKKEALANVNPTKYKIEKFKTSFLLNMRAFFGGMLFKVLLIIIGIPVVLFVFNKFVPIGDLMKRNQSTADIWYGAMNLLRKTVSSDMPYERFKDIDRNKGARPDNLEEDKASYDKNTASNLFSNAGFADILRGSDTKFTEEAFKVKNSYDKIVVLMFLLSGEDGNYTAEDCVNKFNSWLNSLSSMNRESITSQYVVFNKNNVFIAIYSPPTRQADRKEIKEMEFGVLD